MDYDITKLGNWHHDIDLGNGNSTRDLAPPAHHGGEYVNHSFLASCVHKVYGDTLKDKRVVDVACNAGGCLFALQQKCGGLKYGLGFDARANWINQANWVKENTKACSPIGLEFEVGSFEVLDTCANFDIALFNGIFYHLPNPFSVLEKVAAKTNELITISTAFSPPTDMLTKPSLVFKMEKTDNDLSGLDGVSWLPNGQEVIIQMLKALGFVEFQCIHKKTLPPFRLTVIASKIKGLLQPLRGISVS